MIEDAAQAIGAEHALDSGAVRRAGSMGAYGCFSFFPLQEPGGLRGCRPGDHPDPALAERLRVLRMHGAQPKYHHSMIGGNFRLDALQAAVLTVKLRHLDRWTERRRQNARVYRELFGRALLKTVALPIDRGPRHIYNQYVIRTQRRDELRNSCWRTASGARSIIRCRCICSAVLLTWVTGKRISRIPWKLRKRRLRCRSIRSSRRKRFLM